VGRLTGNPAMRRANAPIDTLVAKMARHFGRRVMAFPATNHPFEPPHATTGRLYVLYLHVPFCVTLCPFCSFHRVRFEASRQHSYFNSLRREIEVVSAKGFKFDELYVGGGTPTVVPEALAATIEFVRSLRPIGSISVETNPDDLPREGVRRLADLGVDRLSVGVQSFDDNLLRKMQRIDRYGNGDIIRARLKDSLGRFATLNVDMILNLPHQSKASLERDLEILIDDVSVDQVSLYPLMPADSTHLSMQRHMGELDHTRERNHYELIAARLLSAGYLRSSAWCFSHKPGCGDEYIARREDFIGLGSGAFSYVGGTLYASTFSMDDYERRVESGEPGFERSRSLSQREQMRYYLLMRLFAGILDIAAAECRFAGRFVYGLRRELSILNSLGAIHRTDDEFRLTERGQFVWVVLMREFFTATNSLRMAMRTPAP
jgi:coproporphyrinogen III oxidase-like Fe-S oxidoreductase